MTPMGGITILISPLNWGFGHAGRMIPLALELKKRGNAIVFGADPQLLPLIENELPGIKLVEIPGPRIRYSRFLPQYLCIFLQLPTVIISAFREHCALRRLAEQFNPAVIISDNRFGFFHRRIFSVYVTHQLRIPFPRLLRFLEPAATWFHRRIISRYDLCLVPDYPGPVNLSGRLSHGLKLPGNVCYTGPLSRFGMMPPSETNITVGHPYICLILSGPEPQRSLLLEKVSMALRDIQLCVLSAVAIPGTVGTESNITFYIKPDGGTMRQLIEGCSLVIARSGYTSVMELSSLGRGAVLIPTPGQPEQEYLGDYLNGRYGFVTVRQNNISGALLNAIPSETPAKLATAKKASPPPTHNEISHVTLNEPAMAKLPDSSQLLDGAIGLLPEH